MATHRDPRSSRQDGGRAHHNFKEDQPVGTLLSTFANEVTTLVRQEAQIVKADLRDSADDFKTGIGSLASGAIVAFAGTLVLLLAAVYGIALELPMWLSALIVGGVALFIGLILLARAKKNLASRRLAPGQAAESLRKDAKVARRTLS